MLRKIGNHEDSIKNKLLSELYERIKDKYSGYFYVGFPIFQYRNIQKNILVDSILICNKGLILIQVSNENLISTKEIEDKLYTMLEIKFKSDSNLMNGKDLLFSIHTFFLIPESESNNIEILLDYMCEKLNDNLEEKTIKRINSNIQDAIDIKEKYDFPSFQNTKSEAIIKMNDQIEEFDESQMLAINTYPDGIQRIRGMAGSGKTVVLARKAVELHTKHPDWKILVTYNTRSVKNMLTELITRLYKNKNYGKEPNFENLLIMHAWGSNNHLGLYFYLCQIYNLKVLNFKEAREKYSYHNLLAGIYDEILNKVENFHKVFDCIIIDEAQDLPIEFFQTCLKILDDNKRLVYAYDELQKLNEEAMPNPKILFGCNIRNDTPLKVSYRNQKSVIVTAHAIGMGIYRNVENQNEYLVQIPASKDIWKTIGYESERNILENTEVTLYRTSFTSPNFLGIDDSKLIDVIHLDNEKEQLEKLCNKLLNDIYNEKVPHREIMIIDMDGFNVRENYSKLLYFINTNKKFNKLKIHLAGSINGEDFKRENSIVYSSVYRAKGNETFIVNIINSQLSINELTQIKNRNELFTAITRSKGWVNLIGFGQKMDVLLSECISIDKYNYTIHFDRYPTEEEIANIRKNNPDLKRNELSQIEKMEGILRKVSPEKRKEILDIFNEISQREDLL